MRGDYSSAPGAAVQATVTESLAALFPDREEVRAVRDWFAEQVGER